MKYFTLAMASCLAFIACSKDDNNSNQKTKTQLLTTGSWKYESGGLDLNKDGVIDISFESTGSVPPCLLDNIVTFHSDGTGANDEGATNCGTPASTTFNWSFASNETAINFSGSGFAGATGQFKIKELSDTKFSFGKDTTAGFVQGELLVNLKH